MIPGLHKGMEHEEEELPCGSAQLISSPCASKKYHHAGRGYGYVGASRFRERAGVYLYGKLRRTDFLPVGEEKEDEVLERGYLSVSRCA